MRTTARRIALVGLLVFVATGVAFGQNLLPKKIWELTIRVNAPNASIWVDNVLLQGNVAKVAGGGHNVKVSAPGFFDFNGPVTVSANMTFSVQLRPQLYALTIQPNVTGARVFVDSAEVTGTIPNVSSGSHTVQVAAPGYKDYSVVVNVNSALTLTVTLEPIGFLLSVNPNVAGARVFVDRVEITGNAASVSAGSHTVQVAAPGYKDYSVVVNVNSALTLTVTLEPIGFLLSVNADVKGASIAVNNVGRGSLPYAESLPAGTYSVKVSAPGYVDYVASINLDRAVSVNVQLQGMILPSTLTFVIPPAFLDPEMKPNDSEGRVKIYVDNKLVNPKREMDRIAVLPGRHRIRISSGAFSIQLGDITVQPGMSYILELAIDMKVQAVKSTP
jgi:hypothetical protein